MRESLSMSSGTVSWVCRKRLFLGLKSLTLLALCCRGLSSELLSSVSAKAV